jgi:hypothetical protein
MTEIIMQADVLLLRVQMCDYRRPFARAYLHHTHIRKEKEKKKNPIHLVLAAYRKEEKKT